MKKRSLISIAVAVAAMFALASCGPSGSAGNESVEAIQEKYPAKIENAGDVVNDATLKVGMVTNNPFKGIFNPFLYSSGDDWNVMQNTMAGAFPTDEEFKLILDSDETPINMHIDKDAKEVTYKINPKFKWNDGSPVTTKDIVKTYEVTANQKYIEASQSPRFGEDMYIIEGIQDYNAGKADTIKGLEVISDSEMKIHLTEVTPGVYYGGPFCGEFVNAKSLEGVAMDKIQECDAFRKNPPSYGPYYITKILPGEKVSFEANPYYYKGEAKVKNLEMEVVPTSQQVAAVKDGKYDIVMDPSADVFPQLSELENMSILSRPDLYMSYLGFNVGKWDAANNTVVTDENAKMNDANLKKAMAYALDNDALGEKFAYGLRFTAESPIAPVFNHLHDADIKGYHLDIDKANQLLDEGGYKDVDGDGIREDKNGEPLVINFAMMSGSQDAESICQYYLQQWESIGLKVELVDGRLLEMHNFYDRVMENDPAIDIFAAAFGLASDPQPGGLWGAHAAFNLPRYTSDALQKTMDDINSAEALDDAKNVEFYHEFEKVFMDELPAVPLQNKMEILPVNKRVKMYDFNRGTDFDWSQIELTAENPAANQ